MMNFVAIIVSIGLMFGAAAAVAGPSLLPDDYTIRCQGKTNVGLNWSHGDWHVMNFNTQTLIVRKTPENDCSFKPESHEFKNIYVYKKVCLNIRRDGQPYQKFSSKVCEERYTNLHDGWAVTIACSDPSIYLNPNGWYHSTFIHDDLSDKPAKDYKDSQFVEVGICTLRK